jgi:hypothetical protein
MSSLVDLHLHTTASDGTLSPTRLIRLLADRGLRIVAITDHDSLEGLPEAAQEAANHPGLTLIPGIELSTDVPDGEIHMLGYYMDAEDPGLQETLVRFRGGREQRAQRMVEKLRAMGFQIEWERVAELAQGAIARPHIAQAMVEKGYVAYPYEAFDRYIGRNGPAYVEREKLTPAEAVQTLVRHKGLPVIAHPADVPGLEAVVESLVAEGLVGMEVYYGDYGPDQVGRLLALCQHFNLIPLGGSDYHASGNPHEVEPGTVGPPIESAHRLMALSAARPKPW